MGPKLDESSGSVPSDEASAQPPASERSLARDTGDVFRVGIKVPPFWPEEPDIWFAQIEGQFDLQKITSDSTKFNYVISHLDNQHSRAVKDIIVKPPPERKYEKLKTELIRRLSDSKEKRIKQLMMHEELGERKPSEFLRHLQGLAGVSVDDDFMKNLWIGRLPHGIQTVLAGQPNTSTLEDLADLADRVNDLATAAPRVAAVSNPVPGSALSDLAREVAELRRELREMKMGHTRAPRSRASSSSRRDRSGSASRRRSQSNYRKYPVCWYHSKFGDQSTKCNRPCDYAAAENGKGGL
ncbi:uncharacterized protein LOC125227448 [Leguminivora glycinivorella]|uniref:uncharacterized protein LOC125227448 n=1 Tax=Leguminivora glycinivorella TaxID=1035111 RepID=UPI00200D5DCD|nr:uncharacterized protein LOC125227448 [Leguminivora glycinivorella]